MWCNEITVTYNPDLAIFMVSRNYPPYSNLTYTAIKPEDPVWGKLYIFNRGWSRHSNDPLLIPRDHPLFDELIDVLDGN